MHFVDLSKIYPGYKIPKIDVVLSIENKRWTKKNENFKNGQKIRFNKQKVLIILDTTHITQND